MFRILTPSVTEYTITICKNQSYFKDTNTLVTQSLNEGVTNSTSKTTVNYSTEKSGKQNTEKYPKGITSTTKTATHSTTLWGIWSVSRCMNTRNVIKALRLLRDAVNIWTESAPSLRPGTVQKRGESGTGGMLRRLGRNALTAKFSATSAGNLSLLSSLRERNTVAELVRNGLLMNGMQAKMTNRGIYVR